MSNKTKILLGVAAGAVWLGALAVAFLGVGLTRPVLAEAPTSYKATSVFLPCSDLVDQAAQVENKGRFQALDGFLLAGKQCGVYQNTVVDVPLSNQFAVAFHPADGASKVVVRTLIPGSKTPMYTAEEAVAICFFDKNEDLTKVTSTTALCLQERGCSSWAGNRQNCEVNVGEYEISLVPTDHAVRTQNDHETNYDTIRFATGLLALAVMMVVMWLSVAVPTAAGSQSEQQTEASEQEVPE